MGYQQNALDNNVDIKMNTKVEKIEYSNKEWQINTSNSQGLFIATFNYKNNKILYYYSF